MHCPRVMLIMAFWLVLLVTGQDIVNSLEKRGHTQRYCGETLNAMLMLVCDSVYKRSGATEVGTMNWLPNEPMVNPFVYGDRPFKPRYSAVSLITRQYKRVPHGVADECCRKPCSLDELSSYCGPRFR